MFAIIHVLVICFLIFKFRKIHFHSTNVFVSIGYFLVKCICGIGMMILYRDYFHGGDILGYISESDAMFHIIKNSPLASLKAIAGIDNTDLFRNIEHWNSESYNPLFNDNKTFLLFNILIRVISNGNVYAQIIVLNSIAFLGLVFLYNTFTVEYPDNQNDRIQKCIRFIPLLLPCVLLFGSAVLKESFLLFALGFFVMRLQLLYRLVNAGNFFWFLISSFLLLLIKTYLFVILLPGIFAIYVYKKMPLWKFSRIFIAVYCGGLLELLVIGKFFPLFNLPEYLFGQRLNLMRYAIMYRANSLVNPVTFAPEFLSFLKHIPQAILFAFFHPLPTEVLPWMIPATLDTFIIIAVCIYIFKNRKTINLFSSPFSLLLFFAALVLLMMIGFTNPVLGNIIRFKMPAMLMLAFAICFFKTEKA